MEEDLVVENGISITCFTFEFKSLLWKSYEGNIAKWQDETSDSIHRGTGKVVLGYGGYNTSQWYKKLKNKFKYLSKLERRHYEISHFTTIWSPLKCFFVRRCNPTRLWWDERRVKVYTWFVVHAHFREKLEDLF